MEPSLSNLRGVIEECERSLLNGWMIIDGDTKIIEKIEDDVYTPGTHANADFRLLFHPEVSFFLIKKNERLKEFLTKKMPIEWPDFKDLLYAHFVLTQSNPPEAKIFPRSREGKETIEDAVSALMKELQEKMTGAKAKGT